MILKIRVTNGKTFEVNVPKDEDVSELCVKHLKEVIAQSPEGCLVSEQRLIYAGRVLKDEETLAQYKIVEGNTIHMVKRKTPASSPSNNTPSSSASSSAAASPAAATPPSPFGIPGAAGGMGGNSDAIAQMLNNPMMESLMSNPEVFRSLLTNNPQVRAIMEQNPELAHVFNDPAVLRQTLEMMRNPSLAREMIRNSDRAIANIEGMPGGFNALQRMFTDVQAPLMDALASGSDPSSTSSSSSNADSASSSAPVHSNEPNPNSSPLPNPWGAGGATGGVNATTGGTSAAGNPFSALAGLNLGGAGAGSGTSASNASGFMPGLGSAEDISAFYSNPMVQQAMQNMLSDPNMMQQMMANNPMAQQMLSSNPELAQQLSSPEFLSQMSTIMSNPEALQAMMQLQNALGSSGAGGAGSATPASSPLASLFGAGGGGGTAGAGATAGLGGAFGFPAMATAAAASPNAGASAANVLPPSERFASQLLQLGEMGFTDRDRAIDALLATNGNVQAAIERLLN